MIIMVVEALLYVTVAEKGSCCLLLVNQSG